MPHPEKSHRRPRAPSSPTFSSRPSDECHACHGKTVHVRRRLITRSIGILLPKRRTHTVSPSSAARSHGRRSQATGQHKGSPQLARLACDRGYAVDPILALPGSGFAQLLSALRRLLLERCLATLLVLLYAPTSRHGGGVSLFYFILFFSFQFKGGFHG